MYFDSVKNDPEIINLYNAIKALEEKNENHIYHGYYHAFNVTLLVEKILKGLNYDEEYIDEAKIAAFLHDIGYYLGRKGYPLRSYFYAQNYFKNQNMQLKYEKEVLNAIKNHQHLEATENMMALVLAFANKLDIKGNRLTNYGKAVVGERQLVFINDIDIRLINKDLEITFLVAPEVNLSELEEYGLMPKLFQIIIDFANLLGLKPSVYLNKERWQMFFDIKEGTYAT